MLFFVAALCISAASQAEEEDSSALPKDPDPAKLQGVVEKLVRKYWDGGTLVSLEFRHIEHVRYLIPKTTLYVVNVQAKADWRKRNKCYLMVLQLHEDGFEPELVYKGGGGYAVPTYEIVDIHDHIANPDIPGTSLSKRALQITDPASGNSQSMDRVLLFRRNPETDAFENIFDEVISHTASPPISGFLGYESKLEFRANPLNEPRPNLNDIVVRTHIVSTEDAISSRSRREYSIENVFKWDGERYVGELALPESVSKHQAYVMHLVLHEKPPLFEIGYKGVSRSVRR